MNMKLKILTMYLIGLAGYIVWGVMSIFDPTLRPDFLKFNMLMAAGTIGLVLRDMQPASGVSMVQGLSLEPITTAFMAAPAPPPPPSAAPEVVISTIDKGNT